MKRFQFWTIGEVKRANRNNGGKFFDKYYTVPLSSKIETSLLNGGYFVTSEILLDESNGPRKYTIRRVKNRLGKIETIGEHRYFDTVKEAKEAVRKIREDEATDQTKGWFEVIKNLRK